MRRLGASVDWNRDRFTMDPALSRAVTEVFVRLHGEGLIYRGKRLVNWDPVLKTALSDLEVVSEEEQGSLWHLRYPLSDGGGVLVVATTRPETMLGDAAVAVHPNDERYRHLVGRRVRLPLADREIPVIADDYVDMEFGSGCVKITPAHDFNDYEVGQRHCLAACSTSSSWMRRSTTRCPRPIGVSIAPWHAPASWPISIRSDWSSGWSRTSSPCRAATARARHSRKPLLTDQWFVDIKPLAEPAIRAVEKGDIRFVPEHWTSVYFEWMRKIRDWCISRQLWWGHRIPAWYDAGGRCYVARSEAEARQIHGLGPPRYAASPGRRRAGHLLPVRALAILDAGLAGRDA